MVFALCFSFCSSALAVDGFVAMGVHTVGETKTVKIKITNAQLAGTGKVGDILKGNALTKLGDLVE